MERKGTLGKEGARRREAQRRGTRSGKRADAMRRGAS